MSDVPPLRFPEFSGEWKKCTIKDYGEVVTGNTPPTSNPEYYDNGSYLWASPADLGINKNITDTKTKLSLSGFRKTRNIPKGSVLITCIGSTIGKMGMATETMSSNQQINSIVINDKSDSDFVYYAISRAFPRYLSEVGIQAVPILSKSNFEKLPNYTTCREEQDKIGYFLNLLDERIATQNKIIEDLKKLKSAIIDYAINSLDTDFAKFGSLYETAGEGGTPTTSNTSFYDNGKIPFVKIDDLKQKYLTENKDFITELGLQKSSAWLVPTRSILFSNGASIGEITITTYPVCTKQGILGIVPKSNIDVEFLYYFMSSTYFKKAISRIVTEGTMKTVYLKDINNILCPIPTKEKQQGIAKMPSDLNSKIDYEQSLLKLFIMQKQYLLRQMFI
ncbi:restriction endonuclease subunit S [Bacteroides sp. f07]|uniref:restriction endonuclease subunit S n=1 Tax=Bacteroides sp. f07 TaxID=3132704 RepID=UPI0034BA12FC